MKINSVPIFKLICGDAIEEMKKLPSNSVDLIIADPPYWKVINEKWDYQWRTENDYIYWTKQWIKEASRVIKKTGSFYLFGYFRTLAYLLPEIERENFSLRQQIIINKGIKAISGRATKNYKMFPNVTESVLFFNYNHQPEIKKFLKERQKTKGLTAKQINEAMKVKSNGGGLWSLYTGENILAQVPTKEQWEKLEKILGFKKPYSEVNFPFNAQMGFTDVWDDIDFYKETRHHPTQKPLKLIERIIKASSHEGMTVLDPFIGAGSTALACINLKRNYIGIDIDEKYINISKQRIQTLESTHYSPNCSCKNCKRIKIMDKKASLRNEWNLALLRYAEKVGTEDAPESRRKIVTDISQAIATAVSNREKEIAEEVEEIQTKLHNGHLEAGYKLTNKLLSILKH